MYSREQAEQWRTALKVGRYRSFREASRALGVSRCVLALIQSGEWFKRHERFRRKAPRVPKTDRRWYWCADCGVPVHMPCLKCGAESGKPFVPRQLNGSLQEMVELPRVASCWRRLLPSEEFSDGWD